jgi:outer membrane protein
MSLRKAVAGFSALVLVWGLCGQAMAQEFKIGYVDATKVFEESPQYEAARDALKAEFTRRENEILAKQRQLKKLEDEFARDSAVMSESEIRRLERDILSRRRKLKAAQDEFREDLTIRQNEEFNKLRRQVSEVVQDVGKRENIDLILSDGVAYHSKRVDISDMVLERLKAQARRR